MQSQPNSRTPLDQGGVIVSEQDFDLFLVLLRAAPLMERAVDHLEAYADALDRKELQ